VLIVDESADSREVLRAALERRGAQILEASGADQGLRMIREHRPDLIVLDLEANHVPVAAISAGLGDALQDRSTPIVVLGTARRPFERLPTGQYVPKPYRYAPLVRKIEELLARVA
jgi:CheY-like chemotaxis protein